MAGVFRIEILRQDGTAFYSAGRNIGWWDLYPITTSFPGSGSWGTFSARTSETAAIAAPDRNTADGDISHNIPNATGINTAAIWLIVKLTPAVDEISAGSAIFWK